MLNNNQPLREQYTGKSFIWLTPELWADPTTSECVLVRYHDEVWHLYMPSCVPCLCQGKTLQHLDGVLEDCKGSIKEKISLGK